MDSVLLGTYKHGWEVNIKDKTITLYYLLNLVEKLNKTEQKHVISFESINNILVSWCNVPVAYGNDQHFINLTINLNNGENVSFEGTKNDIIKQQFKEAIILLKSADVKFIDEYNLLESILNTDKDIWSILNDAELLRHKKEQ
ncbi:MAG: hypothetical protein RR585_06805 [Coprobacillus sp.]